MRVVGSEIGFSTRGEPDIVDITEKVQDVVASSRLKDGQCTVFVIGSTAAVTTVEYEPGLLQDIPRALERLFPRGLAYEHHKRWHDGNGHSHVRASFIGPSLVVPFVKGRLVLGTWQQIVFVELDIHARDRKVFVQCVGE